MKKLIQLFTLFIVLSSSVVAQPILTQSNFVIAFTDSVDYNIADTNTVVNTTVGANVVFDYSNLKGYGMVQKAYYLNPASTPGASSFPTATLSEKSDASNENYTYSKSSVDSVTNVGFIADIIDFGLTTAKYNVNPEITMKFPFTYGDSFTDPYAGSFSAVISGFTVTTNAAGSVDVVADAWGRLDLPNSVSIDSVLRVKRVEYLITDPIVIPLAPTIPPITVEATIINYYKPSISKAPILSFIEGSYSQNGSVIQENSTVLSKFPIIISVDELNIEKNIELFPNPSINNVVNLSILLENSTDVQVELLNTLGQTIQQVANKKFVAGKSILKIDTSDLKSGVYLVSVTLNKKTKTIKKLIVE